MADAQNAGMVKVGIATDPLKDPSSHRRRRPRMPLTVTLEFSDPELEYFRSRAGSSARDRASSKTPHEVATAARAEVDRLRPGSPSPFVEKRLNKVDRPGRDARGPGVAAAGTRASPRARRPRVRRRSARHGPRRRPHPRPRGRRDHAGARAARTAARTRGLRGIRRFPAARARAAGREPRIRPCRARTGWNQSARRCTSESGSAGSATSPSAAASSR